MQYLPEPDMAFLPTTASFPQSTRSTGTVRAGTTPGQAAAGAPAWAKPHVSWPFLAATPLTARSGSQPSTVSFTV
ncbi:MAG: hypothetical protein EOO28_30520 [Comamonadaceae bacterium]|nr:MAG: hypothetical protein EOO28_30520 [Comamonadaceae bacterium]